MSRSEILTNETAEFVDRGAAGVEVVRTNGGGELRFEDLPESGGGGFGHRGESCEALELGLVAEAARAGRSNQDEAPVAGERFTRDERTDFVAELAGLDEKAAEIETVYANGGTKAASRLKSELNGVSGSVALQQVPALGNGETELSPRSQTGMAGNLPQDFDADAGSR